jgi:hypothetical protein
MTAMLCSAVVTAQFVAGKATRDALYLAHLDVTSLPVMLVAASVCSIALVSVTSRSLRVIAPARLVPLTFVASSILLLGGWGVTAGTPRAGAPLIYLLISGLGPILGSGFWLVASERFDPRTAKKRFGQITGAGTLGGLGGGLLAERVAAGLGVNAMLPILAALGLFSAWQIRSLATSQPVRNTMGVDLAPELAAEAPRSGLRVLARAPYLRNLAALVLLGTVGASLVDYLFKAQAVTFFGRGDNLLRFFAVFYAATSVVAFVLQTASSRFALEKLGLAVTTATPSIALLAGSAGALVAPGLDTAIAARGGEAVFRGSLFRAGYEVFYTPVSVADKRAAKSIIDVGFDRLGDAAGGGLIRLVLQVAPAQPLTLLLWLAIACSAAALVVSSRLTRGYIHTLERSLLNRAVELDLSQVRDLTTRSTMLRTLSVPRPGGHRRPPRPDAPAAERKPESSRGSAGGRFAQGLDVETLQIVALRSRNPDRVLRVLHTDEPLAPVLIPHVVPLLAWDPVAEAAVSALRRVAERHVGELVDALLDPNTEFAVRRRLARVFSGCTSQRAADGLVLALDDTRFEVRFQCARALSMIVGRNPAVRMPRDQILEVVRREAAVGRPVWESERLLHQLDDSDGHHFADEFVKDRASRSLAHVFTLLSLVLPHEPLQIAFRGLHTTDENLRGTALEYLEGVLPSTIREPLWPFLEDRRGTSRGRPRQRDEIVADLLRSHESIMLNLHELNLRDLAARPSADEGKNAGTRRS